jgi:hypothetical protein
MKKTHLPKPADEILAKGRVIESLAKIAVVGLVLFVLTIGGVIALIHKPESAKDVWVIISPIISGAICFLMGRATSEKSR